MKKDAIIIHKTDNVATVLRDVKAGEKVLAAYPDGDIAAFVVMDDIAYGHKFAVTYIKPGDPVVKYGEVIGRATAPIDGGRHAHVQNIESLRGRGDLE